MDYLDGTTGLLTFSRNYSSSIGGWRDNHTSSIEKINANNQIPFDAFLKLTDSEGSPTLFLARGNSEIGITYVSNSPVHSSINIDESNSKSVIGEDGISRTYNDLGALIRTETVGTGAFANYTYEGQETTVTDYLGRELHITRDSEGNVIEVVTPANVTINYEYTNGNLISLSSSAGISKQYHYEDDRFPHALTGITDENSVRFATWRYDEQGRAISSEHAGGMEKVTLAFNADESTTVTNELGKETTYHFASLYGQNKPTKVEGHASANCIGANSFYTYDSKGYKDLVTDWDGNVTDYDLDDRGLEIRRVEAKGTPEERIIETEWHANFRLPIKITEPDRITEFSYDDSGRLHTKTVKPVVIN
ncbi:hypothetical protein BTA51_02180 [Hahella sp. CCB-MM4]|nr:hypothetical protein BTA51_02180 [Hahella sp. CCB-MM4]